MTISTEDREAGPFDTDGVDLTFPFDFKVFTTADVKVVFKPDNGSEEVLVLNTHYTVVLNADQDDNPGGVVTTTGVDSPYDDGTITVTSDLAETQGTELPSAGGWFPKVVENAFDKLTILIQQLRGLQDRGLRQPISDATRLNDLPAAADRRGMFLFFQDTAAAQPVAAAVTSGAAVTAAWKVVLESATLALGRAAMGFSAYFDSLIAAANAAALRVLIDSPSNAEAILKTFVAAKGDLVGASANDVPVVIPVGAAGTVPMARPAATAGLAYAAALNKAIYGLTYANNGADATNDIDIAVGGAMDATGAYWMTLAAALTKQSDVAWAVGSAAGALDSGAVGNNDYYIWLIARSDTGVVDVLFSLSSTAPTMPANYDFKRLVGWFKRAGGTIVAFTTFEDAGGGLAFAWNTLLIDVSLANTLTTSRRTDALRVPLNFAVDADVHVQVFDASTAFNAFFGCPDIPDAAPDSSTSNSNLFGAAGERTQEHRRVRTSSTGTVAARADFATVDSYQVTTIGFRWARRS